MKVIGIVRSSGREQKFHYGPAVQEADIRERVAELGIELVDVWSYQESATKAERPQFQKMLTRLVAKGQSGEIDAVMFGRLDRMTREGVGQGWYYLTTLEQTAGLKVIFAKDDIDRDNPFADVILTLQAQGAKDEAKHIRERTMSGRRRRALEGKLPTARVPWPFEIDFKKYHGSGAIGIPRVHPERAKWIRKIVSWILDEGLSLADVCRRMDDAGVLPPEVQRAKDKMLTPGHIHSEEPGVCEVLHLEVDSEALAVDLVMERNRKRFGRANYPKWSKPTVKRLLSNPALLGRFETYKTSLADYSPLTVINDDSLAIITQAEYERIQAVLADNVRLSSRNTKRYYTPLKPFVYCHCGRKAQGSYRRSARFPYFSCRECFVKDGCGSEHAVSANVLWKESKAILTTLMSNPQCIQDSLLEQMQSIENRESLEEQRRGLVGEIEGLDSALTKVFRMFEILDAYGEEKLKAEVERIKGRDRLLHEELENLNRSLSTQGKIELTAGRLQDISQAMSGQIEDLSDADWTRLLREFGVKITLRNKNTHVLSVSVDAVNMASVALQST